MKKLNKLFLLLPITLLLSGCSFSPYSVSKIVYDNIFDTSQVNEQTNPVDYRLFFKTGTYALHYDSSFSHSLIHSDGSSFSSEGTYTYNNSTLFLSFEDGSYKELMWPNYYEFLDYEDVVDTEGTEYTICLRYHARIIFE